MYDIRSIQNQKIIISLKRFDIEINEINVSAFFILKMPKK